MSTETSVRAHRFTVGAIACTIVSDGSMAYHDPAPLFFVNALQVERDSVLRAYGIDPEGWHEYISPYCALLINTGQQRVLVDTGAGGFAPTNGQLHDNLHAEGAHFPWPGLGHVVRQDQGFRWEPIHHTT